MVVIGSSRPLYLRNYSIGELRDLQSVNIYLTYYIDFIVTLKRQIYRLSYPTPLLMPYHAEKVAVQECRLTMQTENKMPAFVHNLCGTAAVTRLRWCGYTVASETGFLSAALQALYLALHVR